MRALRPAQISVGASDSKYPGPFFREAYRTHTFCVLSAMALSAVSAWWVLSPIRSTHCVVRPRRPLPPHVATLIGLPAIVGWIVTGVSHDWIDRSLTGRLFLCVGPIDPMRVVVFGVLYWVISAPLIGFVVGAELALMAYFSSRYFGLRAQAAISGRNYGMFYLGSAMAPPIARALRDGL